MLPSSSAKADDPVNTQLAMRHSPPPRHLVVTRCPAFAGYDMKSKAGSPALRVRLALRVDDLLELAEHVHAGQHLLEACIRLALLLDGGDELAVLKLDAVHRYVDLGYVDLVVLAVGQVVVERL